MKPLISIIVSMYNIEKYINDCLNSIQDQTYKNIEVIIIDDGSTDNSRIIANDFCKNHNKFKLYHKENGGPSSARNYGLKKISGDYFMFVDGDDILDINCIQSLLDGLINTKTDIAICNYEKFYNHYAKCSDNHKCLIYNKMDYYSEILNFRKNTYVWGILYSLKYINYIFFPENKYFEDLAVFPYILDNCKKICYIDEKYVKYRQNNNSIVHNYSKNKIDDYVEYSRLFIDKAKYYGFKNECKLYLANAYMTAIYLSIGNDNSMHKEYKRNLKQLLKKTKINSVKGIQGIKFRLFKISPSLGTMFLKIKKRCIT